jgi:hypothetical protein
MNPLITGATLEPTRVARPHPARGRWGDLSFDDSAPVFLMFEENHSHLGSAITNLPLVRLGEASRRLAALRARATLPRFEGRLFLIFTFPSVPCSGACGRAIFLPLRDVLLIFAFPSVGVFRLGEASRRLAALRQSTGASGSAEAILDQLQREVKELQAKVSQPATQGSSPGPCPFLFGRAGWRVVHRRLSYRKGFVTKCLGSINSARSRSYRPRSVSKSRKGSSPGSRPFLIG